MTIENTGENQENHEPKGFDPITDQATLDRIVGERLARERRKYEGYEEYKKKAEELDALKASEMSDLEKERKAREDLEKELSDLKAAKELSEARAEASKKTGIPENLISGATLDEMVASAEAIKAWAGDAGKVTGPIVHSEGAGASATGDSAREAFKAFFSSF